MSRTTIKALWPGEKAEDLAELPNSWGSAPHVWHAIGKRYIDPDFFMMRAEKLWPLWKDQTIPVHQRAVLMLTYDKAYVTAENYARMAADIRQFLQDFPVAEGHANHWPAIASALEEARGIPAIGLWCTSVAEDPFAADWDEEKDEPGEFDWSKTYDLYAELDGLADPRASSGPGEAL